MFIVEAFRNICGASLLTEGYGDYEDFNLKKFQTIHCVNSLGSNLTNFKAKDKGMSQDLSHYGSGGVDVDDVPDEMNENADEDDEGEDSAEAVIADDDDAEE